MLVRASRLREAEEKLKRSESFVKTLRRRLADVKMDLKASRRMEEKLLDQLSRLSAAAAVEAPVQGAGLFLNEIEPEEPAALAEEFRSRIDQLWGPAPSAEELHAMRLAHDRHTAEQELAQIEQELNDLRGDA